uniref:Uncharacterized protein n=1 Tax=Anguilla anguilla TaxID=7936 RepID=A0A0E9QPU4_ANGAN
MNRHPSSCICLRVKRKRHRKGVEQSLLTPLQATRRQEMIGRMTGIALPDVPSGKTLCHQTLD